MTSNALTGKIAANGRIVLAIGLIAGLAFPNIAASLESFIPLMVAALLFLNAFRNARAIISNFGRGFQRVLPVILTLQLVLPIVVIAIFWIFGVQLLGFAMGVVFVLSAPALVGSPNIVAMTGHDPGPSMRILVVGTLLFPLTAFAVLLALPELDVPSAIGTTIRLAGQILAIVVLGAAARLLFDWLQPSKKTDVACDDLTAALLAIIVVGLMVDVGPMLRSDPSTLIVWILGVLLFNIGMQVAVYSIANKGGASEPVSIGVFAANRNIALYMLSLPTVVIDQILLFVGCYQIPMYLTPFLLRRLYNMPIGR